MSNSFSITDALAVYFCMVKDVGEPQNRAVLVGDVQNLIKNISESHSEFRYIEKTYRGKMWTLDSAKEFTLELTNHLRKNCPTYFEVIILGSGVPVVKCKLDKSRISELWRKERGKRSIWTEDIDIIPEELRAVIWIALNRFQTATASILKELGERYGNRDRF